MKTLKVLLQEVVSGIKAWVNSNFAQESNTVHKTGNETVNGVKTFTSTSTYNDVCPYCKNTSISGKLTPEVTTPIQTVVVGNSNMWYGNQTYILDANGECYWRWNAGSFRASDQGQGIWGFDFGVKRDFSAVFLRPQFNNSYWLGESDHQWWAVYAKNYFYNGTAWGLDKENSWSKTQTTKNGYPKQILQNSGITMGVAPADNKSCALFAYDSNGYEIGRVLTRVYPDGKTVTWLAATNLYKNGAIDPTGSDAWANLYCVIDADGYSHVSTDCALTPNVNNLYDLGTSTNKWKTLNGLNPGALSLPDYDRFEPIDFSQWDVNLGWGNTYTPSEDGWLYGEIADTATNSIYLYSATLQDVQGVYRKYGVSAQGNGSQQTGYGGGLAVMIPVRKDIQYRFLIKASAVSDIFAVIFYPCLGNV